MNPKDNLLLSDLQDENQDTGLKSSNQSLNQSTSNSSQSPDPKFSGFGKFWKNQKLRYATLSIITVLFLAGAGWAFYEIGYETETAKNIENAPTATGIEAQSTPTTTSESTAESPTATSTSAQAQTPQSDSLSQKTATTSTTDVKTINDSAIQTKKIATQNCSAYAPDGWTNIENAQAYAFGYDAYNSDQSLGASYLVSAVTVDPYYNYYHNSTPEEFVETTMTTLQGWNNFSWIGGPYDLSSGYTVKLWKANKPTGEEVKAVAQWATWSLNDGTGSYVIALRMGSAHSDKWDNGYAAIVYDVAASVRCTAQVKQNINSSADVINEAYEQKGSSDDRLSEARREATMGYENVYSPSTGEHYEASLSSYHESGPQGSGYYRATDSAGGYEKLEKGFGF